MSKKNKFIDVGLAYMKELGFRHERSRSVVYDKLRSVADKSLANNLINIIDDVRYEKADDIND